MQVDGAFLWEVIMNQKGNGLQTDRDYFFGEIVSHYTKNEAASINNGKMNLTLFKIYNDFTG